MLRESATTQDQFDSELYHEQALKFVLQRWNHHHHEDFTHDPNTGLQDILPPATPDSNPTTNERAPQLKLYAPACNHPDCRGYGLLAGLPPKTIFHKRAFLHLLAAIRDQLFPFLPSDLHSMADFTTHYGLRDGTITGHPHSKGPSLTLPTVILSSSSLDKFELLLDAVEAYTNANQQDLTYHKVPFHLLPFPDNAAERSEYIESLRTIETNYAECHVVRLTNINPAATADDWDALYHLPDYRGLFPQFAAHNPSPESYNLFLQCTIGTMHINPTNIREKLSGFPPQLLSQTLAAITSKTTPRTPNNRPSSANRTKRLAALANRFHTTTHRHQPPHPSIPDTDTPTRKRPASPNDTAGTPTNDTTNTPTDNTNVTTNATRSTSNTTNTYNISNNPYAAIASDSEDEEPNPLSNPTNTPPTEPTKPTKTPTTPPPETDLLSSQEQELDNNNRPPDHLLYSIPSSHFSQDTTHELELLDDYLRSNDPSLIAIFTDQLTNKLTSFNDTDAKTIWQFAHDLIQDPTTTFHNEPPTSNNTNNDMDIDEYPIETTNPMGDKTNHE